MNFDHKLLRLKQCLGVTTDLEVATALGLSKTAFAERKRREAFPVDNLMVLAGENKNIDVDYVLTGNKTLASAIGADIRAAKKNIREFERDLHGISEATSDYTSRKIELIKKFDLLDEAGKSAVEAVVSALSIKNTGD